MRQFFLQFRLDFDSFENRFGVDEIENAPQLNGRVISDLLISLSGASGAFSGEDNGNAATVRLKIFGGNGARVGFYDCFADG